MSRVESLVPLLRRLIDGAGAPGDEAGPLVSLWISLVVQEIRSRRPFTPDLEEAANRLLAFAVLLEIAVEEGSPIALAKLPARKALEQFVERLQASPGPPPR